MSYLYKAELCTCIPVEKYILPLSSWYKDTIKAIGLHALKSLLSKFYGYKMFTCTVS